MKKRTGTTRVLAWAEKSVDNAQALAAYMQSTDAEAVERFKKSRAAVQDECLARGVNIALDAAEAAATALKLRKFAQDSDAQTYLQLTHKLLWDVKVLTDIRRVR